jgi:hypothetical protein
MLMAQMQAQASKAGSALQSAYTATNPFESLSKTLPQNPTLRSAYETLRGWDRKAVQKLDPFYKLLERHPEFPMVGGMPPGGGIPPSWEPETRWMWMMAVNDVRPTLDAIEDLRTLREILRMGPLGNVRAAQISADRYASDWIKTTLPEMLEHPDRAVAMQDITESLERYEAQWQRIMKEKWDILNVPEMWDALKSELYSGARPGGWERAGELGLEQTLRELRNIREVLNYPEPDFLAKTVSKMPNASEWLKNALPEVLAYPNRPGIKMDVQRLIEIYEQYLRNQRRPGWFGRYP